MPFAKKEWTIEFKWGTSRGQNTYGWTICNCLVDGERLGSTKGGGYDLRGTAFANAMVEKFHHELLTLADKAHAKYRILKGKGDDGNDAYENIPTDKHGLYGMSAYFVDEETKPLSISLDGACGFDAIQRIMEVAGFDLKFIKEDVYLLRVVEKSS